LKKAEQGATLSHRVSLGQKGDQARRRDGACFRNCRGGTEL